MMKNSFDNCTLPVEPLLPQILAALVNAGGAVLTAAPGAGKTTLVPPALLDAPLPAGKNVYLLEPRRVAARAACSRIASLLGELPGERCGYVVRGESRISGKTRLFVVTPGVMVRKLLADPMLENVGAVIFDEFHERSVENDLALTLALEVRKTLSPELRILVMSATLAATPVAELLGTVPVIDAPGRLFPVKQLWSEEELDISDPVPQTVRAILRLCREEVGDVLTFLPGMREIDRCAELLENALPTPVLILKLHGALELAEQERALSPAPAGKRKIILATNIAESSLTIDGVRIVIDTGLEKHLRFDPAAGLSFLETVRCSQASADQRSGRAGRTAPGTALRLWTRFSHAQRPARQLPEIFEADLAPLRLALADWGSAPETLCWMDPPPEPALKQAEELLRALGAFDPSNHLTFRGRKLAALPVHPRIGMLCLRSQELHLLPLAAEIAGLLEERDNFRNFRTSDIGERIRTMRNRKNEFRKQLQIRDQLLALMHASYREQPTDPAGRLIAFAFPEWIGRSRNRHAGNYLLAGGKGAKLPPGDDLAGAEFLAVARLEGNSFNKDAMIRLAAPLTSGDLENDFADQIGEKTVVHFDPENGRASARKLRTFGSVILQEAPAEVPPALLAQAVVDEALARQIPLPPQEDKTARSLLKRLIYASKQEPEFYPGWSWEEFAGKIRTNLADFHPEIRNFRDLEKINWVEFIRNLAGHALTSSLDREYPAEFTTPAGSSHRIDYEPEQPTLSARLQEFYGVNVHPSVGRRNFPLRVELLSPAGRPVQITNDLPGFWRGNWPLVQKEMRSRYPKHFWPDHPENEHPVFLKKQVKT